MLPHAPMRTSILVAFALASLTFACTAAEVDGEEDAVVVAPESELATESTRLPPSTGTGEDKSIKIVTPTR